MSENEAGGRTPDPAIQALDRLVGTWQITGDATGTVTYRWMDGGHFLIQEGEIELFGHRNKFTEIIGRERPLGADPAADITSRTYTANGETLDYTHELDGDTLTIWFGERGSDNTYRGTFSDDGNTLTGAWSWPGGGYTATATRQTNTTA